MDKILKKKQEILVGSTKLKTNKNKNFEKNDYFINNMQFNKAYTYALSNKEKFSNMNDEQIITHLKKQYLEYRNNWVNAINKKNKSNPLSIDIELASICDLACPHCSREYIVTPDKIMDFDLYKKIIDEISEMSVPSIKLNWRGEPLLHPNISKCIDYAKRKGILEVIINTNATMLTKKKSEELIDSGLDYMIYSFDGGTKKTYEKMRPGRFKKNQYENIVKNIIDFNEVRFKKKAKFPITKIQMIMTSDTRNEIDEFYKTFENIVDDVTVTQYNERGGGLNDLDENIKTKLIKYFKDKNLSPNTSYMVDIDKNIYVSEKRKTCEQIYQRLMITYNGRVGMCCHDWGAQHGLGFINENAFNENKEFNEVMTKVKSKKKGFELLSNVSMPQNFNEPKHNVSTLKEIWKGDELNKVRKNHECGKVDDVEVCKNCTFKDTYEWTKVEL